MNLVKISQKGQSSHTFDHNRVNSFDIFMGASMPCLNTATKHFSIAPCYRDQLGKHSIHLGDSRNMRQIKVAIILILHPKRKILFCLQN